MLQTRVAKESHDHDLYVLTNLPTRTELSLLWTRKFVDSAVSTARCLDRMKYLFDTSKARQFLIRETPRLSIYPSTLKELLHEPCDSSMGTSKTKRFWQSLART